MLLLIGFAGVLVRLTSARPVEETKRPPPAAGDKSPAQRLPYRLTFSAEPAEVKLASGDGPFTGAPSGILEAGSGSVLFLTVRWKTPAVAGEHRFAKLVLEPTGKPTITHVFDAEGDIDDVFELP